MSEPLKVFITYSHKDKAAKNTLIGRLGVMVRNKLITIWHDNEILPGDRWREEISKNLDDSDILLYLVSAASLTSENCNKELAEALIGKIRTIPIILEDCDWQNHQLSDIQALPDQGKPINEWQPESKGWQNVVAGLRSVVDKIRAQASDSAQEETLHVWIFQQGNFLMMIGQIDKAIEAYSHVTKINPRYVATYNNRSIAYLGKGEVDRAIEDCNKAIELNPELADTYNNRGNIYLSKGIYDRAIADYNKAIQLNPNDADAYNNRGIAYGIKGEIDRAIENYNRAIELNPELAEVYYYRGTIYGIKGEIDRAIENYNRAIKLNPELDVAYNNRGIAYDSKGEIDRAIADYSKAIELDPELALAYCNRGMCWLHLQNWQGTRSDLTIAKSRGVDIIAAFCNDYENVEEFEQRYGVKLPEDIAAMLMQQ